MSQAEAEPYLDTILSDFGANYSVAMEQLGLYQADRGAVEASWRQYFDLLCGLRGAAATESEPESGDEIVFAPLGAASLGLAAVPNARPRTVSAAGIPGMLAGDTLEPIRGGAARIVENMEASLSVATASSMRVIPVRTLEENRTLINRHRMANAQSKVSFTHLTGWAIVRALDGFPRLNDAYAEVEGVPHRLQREGVRLGIAVDVAKKDGTRMLLVPNIKAVQELDFAAYLQAFDALVGRARKGQISPNDFLGTSISLTNPGTVGTTASAPRLMPGQGMILATGALDFPAEYRAMAPRTLSMLGVSKVMTLTSTYDHRIIQGAESGLFLGRIDELLSRGEHGFYDRIFRDLGIPHLPVAWEIDVTPPLFGGWGGWEAGSGEVEKEAQVLQLINAYRVRGHLVADLDPLGAAREPHLDLDPASYGLTLWDLDREFITNGLAGQRRATLREILDVLRSTYCTKIGVEFMFIQDRERKRWIRELVETTRNRATLNPAARRRILGKLVEAESFERFLHAKYIGHKRFSIEGAEALIPLLDWVLDAAARDGAEEVVMGMAHRGRLNVLANTVGKPIARIFDEFEGSVDPESIQGSGDVKYHLGAAGSHRTADGVEIAVSLAPNPSHLEWVNPVVEGMVRAKQDALADRERKKVIPILLHGDAAFAGQGVVAETLNLAELDGYTTGGTVHIVINNQIGFTTLPEDARSSPYCTDVAKMVQAPILHVNGDDPEAVVQVAEVAMAYRRHYHRDVVIDMFCYRRWGHNEGDEPSYTQPLLYRKIKAHPSVAEIYGKRLVAAGEVTQAELDELWAEKKAAVQRQGDEEVEVPVAASPLPAAERRERCRVPGSIGEQLRQVLGALSSVPEGFHLHPKLASFSKKRGELAGGDIDWATAEALAFGSLVLEGVPVRLSGQDSARGTFSQRHCVFYDTENGREYVPLNAILPAQAHFEVHDSLLSEAAVMGFEFGYAAADPRPLVLWEAQFGDFMNGAQVIIDQFICGSETKWGQKNGLVLLLPHGHEGQGPEHSSARLERFLALAAEDNMRIANPSTPAQYFHLLRRQALDAVIKPLVVLTPKSLLRHPRCVSSFTEFESGVFAEVIDDAVADPGAVRRVLMTSGKIYYELVKARDEKRRNDVAIVRLEQFYPFAGAALGAILARFPHPAELFWVQEEPRNMGAWRFVRERFLDGDVAGCETRTLRGICRAPSASPASGSHHVHLREQEELLTAALGKH